MFRDCCPECYKYQKQYGQVELNTLEENAEGRLCCPVCGAEFSSSELNDAWYDIESEERIEEESEKARAEFEFQMMEEGKMNSNGEWIDEDGDLLEPEPWDPMD